MTAQPPIGLAGQHAENRLRTDRRAPEIRSPGRAEIFRVIGVAIEPAALDRAAGAPEQVMEGLALAQAGLTRLAAEIYREMLPAADPHSDAATTTERQRDRAALGAAAASAAEAVAVAADLEAEAVAEAEADAEADR